MNKNRKYSWKKQAQDDRDYKFHRLSALRKFSTSAAISKVVNNRMWCSAIEDQGDLGSCTGNAWVGLLEYNECKNGRGGSLFRDLSRLFLYYNERDIEGTVNDDSGAELRDGAKALATYGVCMEYQWPYDITKFTNKPSEQCYTNALVNKINSYYSLDGKTSDETLTNLKTCLFNGQCFVFGFQVYEYFESQQMADTGILQMPQANEELLGGHAVMAVGYNDYEQRFLIKNSWGKGWGLKGTNDGYFTMPYEYITNPDLASDFWTVVKDV